VQESLQNVIKHSGAEEAKVEIRGRGEEILLRVSDRGKGFEVESPGTKMGIGLVSMRERLRLVGGDISISSHRSEGTQIEVRVPLNRKGNDYEEPSPYKHTQAVGG
jgi:signal transduction histidine kinase